MALDMVYFGNSLYQYLLFFGIIIGSLIVGKIFSWIVANIIKVKTSKTKTTIDDVIIGIIEKPFVFLIFVCGVWYAQRYLTLTESFASFYSTTVSVLFTLAGAWLVMYFADALLVHSIKPLASKTKSDLDDHLLPILRKLVKFVIIIIAIIMVIDNFGYNVGSLVAGLGIGGLAFALAAQDVLKNFFGGIAIAADRPFKIGDRIKLDESTDGFVRDIGLRTTRMETLDGTMLIIPNSTLVDSITENISEEPARKVKMFVGVEYGTSMKKMAEAKKILEDVIKKNKDTKDESLVSFWEFADSSLNFLIIYWIKNLDNIIPVRNDINMEIKKQFEKAGLEFAFPTRTIYNKKG